MKSLKEIWDRVYESRGWIGKIYPRQAYGFEAVEELTAYAIWSTQKIQEYRKFMVGKGIARYNSDGKSELTEEKEVCMP